MLFEFSPVCGARRGRDATHIDEIFAEAPIDAFENRRLVQVLEHDHVGHAVGRHRLPGQHKRGLDGLDLGESKIAGRKQRENIEKERGSVQTQHESLIFQRI